MVWVAIPNFIPNPHRQPQYICINNLRQIDSAANQFALEHHLTNGDRINFPNDLTPYFRILSDPPPQRPVVRETPLECPSGGIYHISKVGNPPTCSLGNTVTPAHVLP